MLYGMSIHTYIDIDTYTQSCWVIAVKIVIFFKFTMLSTWYTSCLSYISNFVYSSLHYSGKWQWAIAPSQPRLHKSEQLFDSVLCFCARMFRSLGIFNAFSKWYFQLIVNLPEYNPITNWGTCVDMSSLCFKNQG
jgi:hypothetical protein